MLCFFPVITLLSKYNETRPYLKTLHLEKKTKTKQIKNNNDNNNN